MADRTNTGYAPTDPLFANQWHLFDADGVDTDINVTGVWPTYTGRGIHIGVYDNGIQSNHPDLDANYDASRYYRSDLVNPTSLGATENHGTFVAGIIAGENDGVGTVGVAYNATVTSVPIYGDTYIDNHLPDWLRGAEAWQQNFDVTNQSWGFSAFAWSPATAEPYDTELTSNVYDAIMSGMQTSATYGRHGLGTVMVAAAGNHRVPEGGAPAGDANIEGAETSSRFSVTVGAINTDGVVTSYSNPGANLLVVAGSGDNGHPGIVSLDRTGTDGYNSGNYTTAADGMWGTSFAAPQVAGVAALMLEANPNLGWRDVKDIMAASATHVGSAMSAAPAGSEFFSWGTNGARDWNGGGYHFSNDYGFGLIDAHAAVRMAETWGMSSTSWNEAHARATLTDGTMGTLPDNNTTGKTFTFHVDDMIKLDTITLGIDMSHTWAADLQITLSSPWGTTSTLMRQGTGGSTDVHSFNWTSNAFLGESGGGYWTLRIKDLAAGDVGTISNVMLDLYGSTSNGDTNYVYTDEYGSLAGISNDTTRGFIVAGGGLDTINAAAVTTGTTLDLTQGIGTIAGRAVSLVGTFDNVATGDGNDIISGNSANNLFITGLGSNWVDGRDGDDVFTVKKYGDDTFIGGNGSDTLSHAKLTFDLNLDLSTGYERFSLIGHPAFKLGSVTFSGIENVIGGSGNDTITGDGNNNKLYGGTGVDTLNGMAGNDTLVVTNEYNPFGWDLLDGGTGIDTLSFEKFTTDVNVDLASGLYSSTKFFNMENITGGAGNDTINGDANNNKLDGGTGVDSLYGLGGDDTLLVTNEYNPFGWDWLDGGAGVDTLSFEKFATGVNVNLAIGIYSSTKFFNIENLLGSSAGDVLKGDAQDNRITGGLGADTIDGGAGIDSAVFAGNRSAYTITATASGVQVSGPDGTDSLTGVEWLVFDDTIEDAAPVAGSVSISDVTLAEGNTGTKDFTFNVIRAAGSGTAAFDVSYAIANSSATVADGDYQSQANGVLHFGAGVNTQTVTVKVNGDATFEGDEKFFVNLSNATNGATISDSQGVGTITNDDSAPTTNTAPVVTAHDVIVGKYGSIAASSMFEAHDQQGDSTITKYAFWDGDSAGGHFTVNGAAQAAGQWIYVNAANLGSVAYVGGASAGAESLYVVAYDGQAWSDFDGLTARTVTSPNDFNGDGMSDILWRSDNGALALWQMNGTQAHGDGIANVGADWHIDGKGDFNGDGKGDLLWRQDGGLIALWQMNGATFKGDGVGSVGSDWHISGIGDFNGDDKSDILWRHDSGAIALWQMNGTQFKGDGVGAVGADWQIAGVGDFNGDGNSDILWRHDSGAIALWQMNGTQFKGDGIGSVGSDWHIANVGDFNGDGNSDILWRNDNGSVATWQMNGTQVTSNGVGSASAAWHIADVGDYNGDGNSDVLWRNDNGTVAMWQMDGAHIMLNATVAGVSNDWHLV